MNDWLLIRQHYGLEKLKKIALGIRCMSPQALSFISTVTHTPEDQFRCYEQIHSKNRPQVDFLDSWYKSSERSKHPHPRKYKVECSLDEDVIQWLRSKSEDDDDYSIYINYFLKKIMNKKI
jgi:hypothetical protein